jgi:hypothetical protein
MPLLCCIVKHYSDFSGLAAHYSPLLLTCVNHKVPRQLIAPFLYFSYVQLIS